MTSSETTLLYHVHALIQDQLLKPLMTVCRPKPVTSRSKCKDEDGTLCGLADEETVFKREVLLSGMPKMSVPAERNPLIFFGWVLYFLGANAQSLPRCSAELLKRATWKEMETWRGWLLAACGRGEEWRV